MKLPYFDESMQPGSQWSSIVNVLDDLGQTPAPCYLGERKVTEAQYRLVSKKQDVHWCTLKICVAGRGIVSHRGKTQKILPGQALLFSTAEEDFFHGIDDGATLFHFYRMTFVGLNPLIEAYTKRHGFLLPIDKHHSIAKRICSYRQKHRSHISMTPSAAAEMVWGIVASCLHIYETSTPENSLSKSCIEWINHNLEGHAGIGACAQELGVSQAHLTRVFQDSIGKTPGAFLIETRMRHAVTLLLENELPIKAIAQKCGYQHASHFSRAFKEAHGVSPKDVRKEPGVYGMMG